MKHTQMDFEGDKPGDKSGDKCHIWGVNAPLNSTPGNKGLIITISRLEMRLKLNPLEKALKYQRIDRGHKMLRQ